MSSLFHTMVRFFQEDDWPVDTLADETALRTVYQGNHGRWVCYAQVREAQQQFLFYSICAETVPEPRRLILADFLTRVNCGLPIGNFEMDFSSGEIRYKTSIDVEGDRLTTALIRQMVYANITVMDTYLPGIMAVLIASVSPAQALAQIEKTVPSSPSHHSSLL